MNAKQTRTLVAIFGKHVPASLRWADAESLLRGLGAVIEERAGSRVAVTLNGIVLHLHRPHPRPEMTRAAVRDLRDILTRAGVEP